MIDRIATRFQILAHENRKAFVCFVTAGDPNAEIARTFAHFLASKSDILEIGMPFSDPMADGNILQKSYGRALRNGHKMSNTFEIALSVREAHPDLPLLLMGYINPILAFGREKFLDAAKRAGIDGLIIVDLPPEEDDTFCDLARKSELHWIRLVTPTTAEKRLCRHILPKSSGFLYCVSTVGITGTQKPDPVAVQRQITIIRKHSSLPVVVGFGIKDSKSARPLASISDGIVVGSAISNLIEQHMDNSQENMISAVENMIENIKEAL